MDFAATLVIAAIIEHRKMTGVVPQQNCHNAVLPQCRIATMPYCHNAAIFSSLPQFSTLLQCRFHSGVLSGAFRHKAGNGFCGNFGNCCSIAALLQCRFNIF